MRFFKRALFCLSLLLWTWPLSAQNNDLESPYYVYPREGDQHIELSHDWTLSSTDKPVDNLSELKSSNWFSVNYPTSVQMALYKAGIMGDPYAHLNSIGYEKMEQKVWYYKKHFTVSTYQKDCTYLLNFDGIDYFARVWFNGQFIGKHSGMFGGPIIDVSHYIKSGIENELIVEVTSANYGNSSYNPYAPKEVVKSWHLSGGSAMEPYFNFGLWRDIRLEIVPKYHMDRPFLFTQKIEQGKATIGFNLEIFTEKSSLNCQLHPWKGSSLPYYYDGKLPNNARMEESVSVVLDLIKEGKVAYTKEFHPHPIKGRSWLEETFTLDNPDLWYPNGLGNPDFYLARVKLFINGNEVDCLQFNFGIRTIEHIRSAGIRTADRWNNWQFVVNGKKFFLKGVNWMPVDALYDLTPDKYDWAVKMAKNLGVQLFRVWGSGLIENNAFYDACAKYGIMVWQEFNIANMETPEWPQNVLESEVCQNIFRLRNQPALIVWCGGNEFNPYAIGNAASMDIIERNLAIFDPTRLFLRTSPDDGSFHLYPDFDPAWYKRYSLVPFIAETGIHCVTDAADIKQVVSLKELNDLSGMFDKSFAISHPEFVNHFAEYDPSRVPRMLSRASHIEDISKPTIDIISEATQIGAGEFYQIMSEGIQSNYPVTTGLIPWVYKRPWPVVAAINLVDGMGQPSATYYFLKRTYEPIHVLLDIKRLLWAPGETFPISVNVLNGVDQSGFDGRIKISIFDNGFKRVWQETKSIYVTPGTSVTKLEMEKFQIPETYKEKYFFITVSLINTSGQIISHSEYWPRTLKIMEDPKYYAKYITEPTDWPTLNKGPWLKYSASMHKTAIELLDLKVLSYENQEAVLSFKVRNKGEVPSFMTQVDVEGVPRSFYASDNFFWLEPGTVQEMKMTIHIRNHEPNNKVKLVLKSWNSKRWTKEINL